MLHCTEQEAAERLSVSELFVWDRYFRLEMRMQEIAVERSERAAARKARRKGT